MHNKLHCVECWPISTCIPTTKIYIFIEQITYLELDQCYSFIFNSECISYECNLWVHAWPQACVICRMYWWLLCMSLLKQSLNIINVKNHPPEANRTQVKQAEATVWLDNTTDQPGVDGLPIAFLLNQLQHSVGDLHSLTAGGNDLLFVKLHKKGLF